MRSASFSSRLISTAWVMTPLLPLERVERQPNLLGAGGDDERQFARAEPDRIEPVQPDQRRRRVDRVHDVVERPGQRVDVFAIERRDEGAVEPLR